MTSTVPPQDAVDTHDADVRYAEVPKSYYDIIVAFFVGLLLMSGVGATKLFEGPRIPWISDWFYGGGRLIFDGGAFLFPLSYVIGDIMTEVYGWQRAKRAIGVGFVLMFLASATYWLVSLTTPVPGFENWNGVLAPAFRIALGSLAGFLVGELLNSLVLIKIKERTAERHVAFRLITSTLVGEFMDTLLFCVIAYVGTISIGNLANYTVTGYVYKCLVELLVVPITLQIIKWLKHHEPTYRLS